MNTEPKCTARELLPFALIAYGLPFLMGIPLRAALGAGYNTDAFANAQMFYPAAGAMAALLLAHRGEPMPRRFFGFYFLSAAAMLACCIGVVALPAVDWLLVCTIIMVAAGVLGWIFLLTQKKPLRQAAGLCWRGGVKALGYVALFLLLRTAAVFISVLPGGQPGEYLAYWTTADPYILFLVLIPNFLLSFLPFFGEEYGWRYFLQPRLQDRFGKRGGVLALGVLWGLWHLPLNLFYYAPDTALQSIVSQIITCITLGIFFAWAYMKTGNVWVPTLLHYFNNNMIVVYSGTAQLSGQVIGWGDVLVLLVVYGAIFVPFLAAKVFRDREREAQPA